VFPELTGVVRELYEEDADWVAVLPGIIDDEIADDIADRQYARTFASAPPYLSIESIRPLCHSVIFEIPPSSTLLRSFADGILPAELQHGQILCGKTILYADLNRKTDTLIVVTATVSRPKWHDNPGLDTPHYELHLVSYRQPSQAQQSSLLFVNTGNGAVGRQLLRILAVDNIVQAADPARLYEAIDGLDWKSVSSLGVRNTYAGRGSPSYRSLAGSGLNRGLREADTAFGSFGHAMVQISNSGGAYTAGVSTGKGKYWETRYVPLRSYDLFVERLAERYWFPPTSKSGQLIPQLSRGKRLVSWPIAAPLAVEFNAALIGIGWHVPGVGPLESLDLRPSVQNPGAATDTLPLELVAPSTPDGPVVWHGYLNLLGNVSTTGPDLMVQRGFGVPVPLADLLSDRPPTVFFVDGTTAHGTMVFDSRAGKRGLPPNLLVDRDWPGVDITAETKRTAGRHGQGKSIHESLEDYLQAKPRRAKHRWILCNDGAGELADYLVIEVDRGNVFVGLWHAKYAHGSNAGVRVTDMEEVVAQAIKSRRWITEVAFWQELGARLKGRSKPQATVVDGNSRLLEALCGEIVRWERRAFSMTRPIVTGEVVIVQPGLSRHDLESELAQLMPSQRALQTRDLLAVFHDSVSPIATITVMCSR